jgi:hypothetical protein
MTDLKKPGSVALAFAAALLAAPALSGAMPREAAPAASADPAASYSIQPSAAAMRRLQVVYAQQVSVRPRPPTFIDLWPEVTHVESVRRP